MTNSSKSVDTLHTVQTGNDYHKHTMRRSRFILVTLAMLAIVTGATIIWCSYSYYLAISYNSTTELLKHNMNAWNKHTTTIDNILAAQEQIDQQFKDLQGIDHLTLHSLKNDIEHNAQQSQAFTRQLKNIQNPRSSESNASSNGNPIQQGNNTQSQSTDAHKQQENQEKFKQLMELNNLSHNNAQDDDNNNTSTDTKPW